VRVPAGQKVGKADEAQPLTMQISTQKILGFVLLKVEKISIGRQATPR
jgi:uncharacterized protein GlcG (DUF336 family)